MARKIEANLLHKQEVIGRVRGEKLDAEEAQALADAQARLGRPGVSPDLNAKGDAGGTREQWRAPDDVTARVEGGEIFSVREGLQIQCFARGGAGRSLPAGVGEEEMRPGDEFFTEWRFLDSVRYLRFVLND